MGIKDFLRTLWDVLKPCLATRPRVTPEPAIASKQVDGPGAVALRPCACTPPARQVQGCCTWRIISRWRNLFCAIAAPGQAAFVGRFWFLRHFSACALLTLCQLFFVPLRMGMYRVGYGNEVCAWSRIHTGGRVPQHAHTCNVAAASRAAMPCTAPHAPRAPAFAEVWGALPLVLARPGLALGPGGNLFVVYTCMRATQWQHPGKKQQQRVPKMFFIEVEELGKSRRDRAIRGLHPGTGCAVLLSMHLHAPGAGRGSCINRDRSTRHVLFCRQARCARQSIGERRKNEIARISPPTTSVERLEVFLFYLRALGPITRQLLYGTSRGLTLRRVAVGVVQLVKHNT